MAKIKALRRCKLFQSLGYRDLAILAPHVIEESAMAEKWITQEGSTNLGLVVVKSGKAEITSSATGTDKLIIGPGDFFGELSFVHGGTHRVIAAKALERCEYLKIPPSAYRKLLSEAPDVAGKIAQGVVEAMSEKMASTLGVLGELISDGGGARV